MTHKVVQIPHDRLEPDTLWRLVSEFVTRDGTDYGEVEVSAEVKVGQVIAELHAGRAVIVFDEDLGSVNIVPGPIHMGS